MIELIPIKDRKGKCCLCGSEFIKYRIIYRTTTRDVCNVCALVHLYISEDIKTVSELNEKHQS